jgi:hypothetical protein
MVVSRPSGGRSDAIQHTFEGTLTLADACLPGGFRLTMGSSLPSGSKPTIKLDKEQRDYTQYR